METCDQPFVEHFGLKMQRPDEWLRTFHIFGHQPKVLISEPGTSIL